MSYPKKSCELARDICKEDDTLINQDALAGFSAKLAPLCLEVDLQEFTSVNQELMDLAAELRDKTGDEKYTMMIFRRR